MGVGVLVFPLVGLITSLTTLTTSEPHRQDSYHHQRNLFLHDYPPKHHHNNLPLHDDPLHQRHHHHTASNTNNTTTNTFSTNDTSVSFIDNSGNNATLPVTYNSVSDVRKRDKPRLSDIDDEEAEKWYTTNNNNDYESDDNTTPAYDDNANATQTHNTDGRNASLHTEKDNSNGTKFDYDDGRNASEGDDEEEYTPYDQRPETYLVPCVFAIIFVTGVVGNGALIFMFLKHPKLR